MLIPLITQLIKCLTVTPFFSELLSHFNSMSPGLFSPAGRPSLAIFGKLKKIIKQ